MMSIKRFPNLPNQKEDENPSIQLFGRRFYKDQTPIEYLIEFLLVFTSPKTIGRTSEKIDMGFPDMRLLNNWPEGEPLFYNPQARLVLKLFTFLGASKLETRHPSHIAHFTKILSNLNAKINTPPHLSKESVLKLVEQILLGFVGVAQNRTWCTQTFLPLAPSLIAREAIWKRLQGREYDAIDWYRAIEQGLFTFSNHDFMARGGEVLYLQLCNLFSKVNSKELTAFETEMGFSDGEASLLKSRIEKGLRELLETAPALDKLGNWIEQADTQTLDALKKYSTACGWCPEESWRESYLFAHEMANICDASIDPIEKVEMLVMCCTLQVLRSLCAQSSRRWKMLTPEIQKLAPSIGFTWIVTSQDEKDKALRGASVRNFTRLQEMIHGALRSDEITIPDRYDMKNADEQGQDLLAKLGKAIEFVVPRKGPGAHFVLTDFLIRYFVLALISPGERLTRQSFEDCIFRHYGIALQGNFLEKAIKWTFGGQQLHAPLVDLDWFEAKLRSLGFLVPLSDAVSLVYNPFETIEETQRGNG